MKKTKKDKKNNFVKGNSRSRRTQRRKEEREQCSGYTSETSNNISETENVNNQMIDSEITVACKQPDFFRVADPV